MTALPRLPFGFARKHGVAVLGLANGKARIACRPDVKPEALLELRRFLGTPLAPEKVAGAVLKALRARCQSPHAMEACGILNHLRQFLNILCEVLLA